jgi:hypothetical protein
MCVVCPSPPAQWIRDLALLATAPLDNLVNSNFFPLPQSNAQVRQAAPPGVLGCGIMRLYVLYGWLRMRVRGRSRGGMGSDTASAHSWNHARWASAPPKARASSSPGPTSLAQLRALVNTALNDYCFIEVSKRAHRWPRSPANLLRAARPGSAPPPSAARLSVCLPSLQEQPLDMTRPSPCAALPLPVLCLPHARR